MVIPPSLKWMSLPWILKSVNNLLSILLTAVNITSQNTTACAHIYLYFSCQGLLNTLSAIYFIGTNTGLTQTLKYIVKDRSIFSQLNGIFKYNCPPPLGEFYTRNNCVRSCFLSIKGLLVNEACGWCGFPVFSFWNSQRQLLGIKSWQNYCPARLLATAHKTPPTLINFMANSVNRTSIWKGRVKSCWHLVLLSEEVYKASH